MADPLRTASPGVLLRVAWLGRIAYREAWDLQKRLHAARVAGRIPDTLLLLEHDAVLTLGRGADPGHVLASPDELARRGIEVLHVERGGEVTYHGPGQLVGYPIMAIGERGLLVRPFVRALEAALVAACGAEGVAADRRDGHPGCWCNARGLFPRKIGALGLRIERGVSYHGIALNVDPELADFGLIDACGMPGVISTSVAREQGRLDEPPSTDRVAAAGRTFAAAFADAIGAPLAWATADVLDGGDAGEPGAAPAEAQARVDAGSGASAIRQASATGQASDTAQASPAPGLPSAAPAASVGARR